MINVNLKRKHAEPHFNQQNKEPCSVLVRKMFTHNLNPGDTRGKKHRAPLGR